MHRFLPLVVLGILLFGHGGHAVFSSFLFSQFSYLARAVSASIHSTSGESSGDSAISMSVRARFTRSARSFHSAVVMRRLPLRLRGFGAALCWCPPAGHQ